MTDEKCYCRYCANAYLQDDNLIWCEPKNKFFAGRQITRLRKCNNFEFNPIDVADFDKLYKPRQVKESRLKQNQISFFDKELKE